MPELAESQLARGMRDILPGEMARVRRIEAAFRQTCGSWGYGEVRTPLIEHLYLFTAAGTLSPQTLDRVYSFLDWDGWSGERVVLRPDSTIAAARLYAEHYDGGRVAKLFYSQPVLRFTDEGSREEWQCGVELIGDTGRAGDIELVSLALDSLAAVGLRDVRPRLSHAGIVRAVLAAAGLGPDEQAAAYDRLLDGDLSVVEEVEARLPQLNAPLHLLFEVEGEGTSYIANVRAALAQAVPGLDRALDELAAVAGALEARGARPAIAAVLARRFEYYSGIVMSFQHEGQRVGAGGRYDDLVELVGGGRVPASGFALFLDPLTKLIAADADAAAPVRVHAVAETPAAFAAAQDAAQALRASGFVAATVSDAGTPAGATLVCGGSPPFELDDGGGVRRFERLGDVIAALGRSQ
jgi:histidyl-tRNA synthetase